jgi:hypothetical protein
MATQKMTGDGLRKLVAARLKEHRATIDPVELAAFTKMKVDAANSWLSGGQPLGGMVTLRIWYFLDALRVDQPELQRARKRYEYGAYIGELLAYDVVSQEDAGAFAESTLGKGPVQIGAILSAARAEGRGFAKPTYEYEELVRDYGDKLIAARNALRQKLGVPIDKPTRTTKAAEVTPAPTPAAPSNPGKTMDVVEPVVREQLVYELAQRLSELGVTAQYALAVLTDEERALLRTLTGKSGIFDLSNALNRLSSTRANEVRNGA